MAGIRVRRRAAALFAAAATLVVGGLATTPPVAASGSLTVVWPTLTRFNPDVTDYVVDVSYSGTGTVWLVGATYDPQLLAPSGPTQVEFRSDGWRSLVVWECPTDLFDSSTCGYAGASHGVSAYRALHLTLGASAAGPKSGPRVLVEPSLTGMLTIEWGVYALDAPDGSPLVSGSTTIRALQTRPPIGETDLLLDGTTYLYRASYASDSAEYEHLDGSVEGEFVWDDSVDAALLVGLDRIYPGSGSPFESSELAVRTTDPGEVLTQIKIRVTSPDHAVPVYEGSAWGSPVSGGWATIWSGRAWGSVLEPGHYQVRASAQDHVGNWATYAGSVEIGNQVTKTWKRTFRAVPTVVGVVAGKCGAVYRPARESWPGSVGYASGSCRKRSQMRAISYSAVTVPELPEWAYRSTRLSAFGGAHFKAAPGHLALALARRGGRWADDVWIGAPVSQHRGPSIDGSAAVLGRRTGQPAHVMWRATVARGVWYDIKNFTIEVDYIVLR